MTTVHQMYNYRPIGANSVMW